MTIGSWKDAGPLAFAARAAAAAAAFRFRAAAAWDFRAATDALPLPFLSRSELPERLAEDNMLTVWLSNKGTMVGNARCFDAESVLLVPRPARPAAELDEAGGVLVVFFGWRDLGLDAAFEDFPSAPALDLFGPRPVLGPVLPPVLGPVFDPVLGPVFDFAPAFERPALGPGLRLPPVPVPLSPAPLPFLPPVFFDVFPAAPPAPPFRPPVPGDFRLLAASFCFVAASFPRVFS